MVAARPEEALVQFKSRLSGVNHVLRLPIPPTHDRTKAHGPLMLQAHALSKPGGTNHTDTPALPPTRDWPKAHTPHILQAHAN